MIVWHDMTTSNKRNARPELNDQVKIVINQLPVIILINLPIVLLLAYIYWPYVNQFWLSVWASSMLIVMFIRIFLVTIKVKPITSRLTTEKQEKVLVLNSIISGVLWGWAGYLLFVPEMLEYQLIILLVLIVKGTGSVSTIINSLPAFCAYFPTSMLPISIMFLIQKEATAVALGILCLLYIAVMLLFGRNINRTLSESLRIRYENQQLLKETEERKQEAEKANLAKTHFLAAASHDLRQPIHAMSLLLNILEDKFTTKEAVIGMCEEREKDVLFKMRGTVESLQNLLDALLDISRLDAGAVTVNNEEIDLLTVFQNLQNELQVLAEEKKLTLIWPRNSIHSKTDPALIEQILRNLINNAIRYTEKGKIVISNTRIDNKVKITVSDTGIGIAEDQQKTIFDEFYQVGNQQRDRSHGLGLGLAIVKRTVELLGSQIHIQSALGKGTSFSFTLDVLEHTDTVIPRQDIGLITSKLGQEQGNVVVLIEDDKDVKDAMQLLLEKWGYITIVGSDSDSILAQLSTHSNQHLSPDIIISDLQLAENKNGLDEVKHIKKSLKKPVSVLILTGNIQAEQSEDVKASGWPILYKPVAPARLRAFLRSCAPD